ncbi:hypothetical protein JMJ78_0000928 [Colletotrichum scovillei]|nr:hypothetical protein JMJ78_0000928 [Colletotrichum scovillei]
MRSRKKEFSLVTILIWQWRITATREPPSWVLSG